MINLTKQEYSQDLISNQEQCFQEIRYLSFLISKKEKWLDRIMPTIIFSWLFTAPCIIFLFLAPIETQRFFAWSTTITIVLHLAAGALKKEIKHHISETEYLYTLIEDITYKIQKH
ncbi:hypothetical protein P9160_01120 [Bacillus halotolerans]|uniref:hypothetical protein n=1 Tax=Bacillus halotolerans TaxID=260554 RepID=UPI002DB67234|nr:hypothetical protein [Bacillus halotolerans]MEC3756029.1 hypothetical protein [Bacillus halotolerans]